MNTKVKIRNRKRPPLIEVYDHEGAQPQLFTRLVLGIAPPAEDGTEPGYACVMGELYDNDPRQKQRKKVLLDEGTALDAKDFPAPIVSQHWDRFYREVTEEDGNTRDLAHIDHPTLSDLQQVAVALKDLYHPVPDDPRRFYMPGWILPQHPRQNVETEIDPFAATIRATWGLQSYPSHFQEQEFRGWFPTYRNQYLRAAIGSNPPLGSNPAANRELVETLLARDDLTHNDHCTIFLDSSRRLPHALVGALCAVWQAQDWAYMMRDKQDDYDGYETIEEVDDQREKARRSFRTKRARRISQWLSGINGRPR